MTAALFGVLTALALADALNPFTVAAQAYLLGTPKPMLRSIAFLLGTYVTYFLGGVLLLQGWSYFLARLAPLIPPLAYPIGEIVLGLALLGFAIWSARKAAAGTPFTPPTNLSIPATLGFAFASTIADLTSALPYFAAVNRIAADVEGLPMQLLALAWYNLLYCSPMIALILARLLISEAGSDRLFGRMRAGIDWAFAKLLPPLMGIAGVALVGDGARRLF